jgi:sucrose phosphorylase
MACIIDEVTKGILFMTFLPGLTIHTIENKTSSALLSWAKEIIAKGYKKQ